MLKILRWFSLLASTTAFLWVLVEGPWWFDGEFLRSPGTLEAADGVVITGFRAALVAAVGGAVAVLTYLHTRRRDREEVELARDGKSTDRYMEAVKLLASPDSIVTRLGGIYALERIMYESEKDRETAIEVLTGFMRTHVRATTGEGLLPHQDHVPDDLQAAADVIGRRPDKGIHQHENSLVAFTQAPDWRPLVPLDLRRAELAGIRLEKALLYRADLRQAELTGADLSYAKCAEAEFHEARAQGAKFHGADVSLADFSGADLRGADLSTADVSFTIFAGARLDGATFSTYANISPRLCVGASMVGVTGISDDLRKSLKEFVARIDVAEPGQ
ncbi:pentapeptide repeat-containing protein [Streptomyces alfalfae]|uniref:Pentapeptide repeat-containing protein n=1 Tax=Streptomyces alfalfae TaxID=1642299 RepID=A0ABM6H243_9ACTN|nr:pentapeptide repeat-containing protein [Streptomyces alfalfae]APY90094.1 hypothetical protein A7J05_34460 [Streptomyces alfalfae]AYA20555.1 pentapeptide repeat-containing protein [Streptomyces fradiae]RXX34761.1 pentapeptide repeat-containing protein [Streptomyces alfalfae]RZM91538.1 pentapeptide repeat-containing protein [Streptomyces alfalfae]